MVSSNLFDEAWYLRTNPDVAAAVEAGEIDAWTHFQQSGRFEGRAPGPLFDPDHYLTQNPDVAVAVENGQTNAYDHFLAFGAEEERGFVPFFDPDVYLRANPDVSTAVEEGQTTAIEHFLSYGSNEVRGISPFFDLPAYLEANPDVAQATEEGTIDPLSHLLTYGFSEGRPLGNGVSLAQFANDPTFTQAVEAGDAQAALARVAAVSPFIPSFEPTVDDWEAPANTPIPVDFVPIEGEYLEVPPSVEVPDDVELPEDLFPTWPGNGDVTHEIGVDVSDVAQQESGALWVGSNNSADQFSVATATQAQLELALKGYLRGEGNAELPDEDDATYSIGATSRAGFVYSLAALDSVSLKEKLDEGYSFLLNIDTDPGEGVEMATFELRAEELPPNSDAANDSGYEWVEVGGGGRVIADDEGDVGATEAEFGSVTQNIQSPIWYADGLEIGQSGVLRGGEYAISLQAYHGEEQTPGNLVAEQVITLGVESLEIDYAAALSDFATDENGNMYNGVGNVATGFAVHQIALESEATLEVALGAQQRFGDVYEMDPETGVIHVTEGVPTFKFSVGVDGAEQTLADVLNSYDVRLLVDTDASAGTEFIVLNAVPDADGSTGALDWMFEDSEIFVGDYRLEDDAGTDNVSQNIQVLGWYQPDENGELFGDGGEEVAPGVYSVVIEVYEKGSVNLVGATEMTFHIDSAA